MMEWLKRLFVGGRGTTETAPAYWQEYVTALQAQAKGATPVPEAEFVVFDTETTGLDQRTDRVLSIGAVRVKNLQVLVSDSFECLVQQPESQPHGGAEIHGILAGQLREGITEQEALQKFIRFIGGAVLVGHHVAFDVGMLNQMLRRQGINGKLRNKMVDTAQLAIRLERRHADVHTLKSSDYSLDALCARYKLPTDDRHTAAGDAFATALLLLKLLALARKRGIHKLGELVK